MTVRKNIARLTLGAGTLVALLAASTGVAHAGGPYPYAGNDDIGRRLTVCANDLLVRGPNKTLLRGQTFDVKSFSGPDKERVWGFAYGYVNDHGWVENGWFCDA
ncbi:hypothetical protein [Spongiactinospora sp. 9N601]|uniref:hypothetical protein n=1 Tax=Spongiactinospora sp. 9N601 TaxID=3375149 RepID=UPI00378BDDE9